MHKMPVTHALMTINAQQSNLMKVNAPRVLVPAMITWIVLIMREIQMRVIVIRSKRDVAQMENGMRTSFVLMVRARCLV
jgi:hypothetical protein